MKEIIDEKFELFKKIVERAIDTPDLFPDEVTLIPLTDDEWKTIFTDRRIELIRTIEEKKPKSVGQLTKLLRRHQEAVSRDLKHLESVGIIKMETRGKMKIPMINKKLIVIPLSIPIKVKK